MQPPRLQTAFRPLAAVFVIATCLAVLAGTATAATTKPSARAKLALKDLKFYAAELDPTTCDFLNVSTEIVKSGNTDDGR